MLENISVCPGQFLFVFGRARYAPAVSLSFSELLTAGACSQRNLRSIWQFFTTEARTFSQLVGRDPFAAASPSQQAARMP